MKYINDLNFGNNVNNYCYFQGDEYDFFEYIKIFSKNKNFFKKTKYGTIISLKQLSFKRKKNFDFNNSLINSWVKQGLKLNFLKHYNIFLENFFFQFLDDPFFFKNYPNFDFVFNLLDTKFYHFKFEKLLKYPIKELEYLFDLKLKKLNKKLKKKLKKKYSYSVKYIQRKKRVKHILNLFYNSSSTYFEKKYYNRIFLTFLYVIFDTQNTPIWERKLNAYNVALKLLKKK